MNTSKIADLRENVGTWTASDNSTFYKHNVQLENGIQGQAFGKSPNAPYQVGDLVEYEEKRTQNGTRLKIRKPSEGGNFSKGGNYNRGGGNPARDGRIMRQTAMKVAAQIVGPGGSWDKYKAVADMAVAYFEGNTADAPQQIEAQAQPPQETRTNPAPFAQANSSDNFPF